MKDVQDAPAQSLRVALRAATNDAHEALHHHPSFAGLNAGTLGQGGYLRLMERLHGFYVPLDAAIARVSASMPDQPAGYRYQPRAQLLAQDIKDLGGRGPVPLCDEIGSVVTPGTLWGVLYVIEGSVMGGAGLDRMAQRLLSPDHTAGRSYWAWCRAEGRHQWLPVRDHLDRMGLNDAGAAEIVRGARDTFAGLARWVAPLET